MSNVNHPDHYKSGKYECIDVMRDILTDEQMTGFCLGNALKYLWRAGKKNDFTEDIRKAVWYLNYLTYTQGERCRMNARPRIQDKVDEAKQHLEVLEELRDDKKAWLQFYDEYGKGINCDDVKALVNALDFAIDFIKWGMK